MLTTDLFLNLEPFCRCLKNGYGRNMNLREFLDASSLELRSGVPAELYGFPEFSSDAVLAGIAEYMVGNNYPALAQCLVARPR